MNLTDFDNYFLDTCATINQKIKDNYPSAAVEGILIWAQTNEPELFKAEERAYALIDPAYNVANGLDKFQKTVLEWGRVVLKIYKKYSETPTSSPTLSFQKKTVGGRSNLSDGPETKETHQMSFKQ